MECEERLVGRKGVLALIAWETRRKVQWAMPLFRPAQRSMGIWTVPDLS